MELPSPTLELIGPEVVYLNEGDSYLKCPVQAPLDVVCEGGAVAMDSIEGDISNQVRLLYPRVTPCAVYHSGAEYWTTLGMERVPTDLKSTY